ncbi:unnamed protein product [Toxocara canis]|uniref:USP domain-containing protein n=1 Tax=Toxocara canis TaxID=6265 RepID=A0A183UMX3_TOXCA|nr:unnamed protein product [Toxocara canis]
MVPSCQSRGCMFRGEAYMIFVWVMLFVVLFGRFHFGALGVYVAFMSETSQQSSLSENDRKMRLIRSFDKIGWHRVMKVGMVPSKKLPSVGVTEKVGKRKLLGKFSAKSMLNDFLRKDGLPEQSFLASKESELGDRAREVMAFEKNGPSLVDERQRLASDSKTDTVAESGLHSPAHSTPHSYEDQSKVKRSLPPRGKRRHWARRRDQHAKRSPLTNVDGQERSEAMAETIPSARGRSSIPSTDFPSRCSSAGELVSCCVPINSPLKTALFANLGATCYVNAVLQAIFSVETFSKELLKMWQSCTESGNKNGPSMQGIELLSALSALASRRLVATAEHSKHLLRSVLEAIKSRRFYENRQEDAQEFMAQVFDQLSDECDKVLREQLAVKDGTESVAVNPVKSNFMFTFQNDIVCERCLVLYLKRYTSDAKKRTDSVVIPRFVTLNGHCVELVEPLADFFSPSSLQRCEQQSPGKQQTQRCGEIFAATTRTVGRNQHRYVADGGMRLTLGNRRNIGQPSTCESRSSQVPALSASGSRENEVNDDVVAFPATNKGRSEKTRLADAVGASLVPMGKVEGITNDHERRSSSRRYYIPNKCEGSFASEDLASMPSSEQMKTMVGTVNKVLGSSQGSDLEFEMDEENGPEIRFVNLRELSFLSGGVSIDETLVCLRKRIKQLKDEYRNCQLIHDPMDWILPLVRRDVVCFYPIITSCLQAETERRGMHTVPYRPVTYAWRAKVCASLGLVLQNEPIRQPADMEMSFKDRPIRVASIAGDGNCLFRAVAYAITGGSDEGHANVRQAIVSFELEHEDRFRTLTNFDEEGWREHLNKLMNDGNWGGDCEIFACATMLQTEIWTFLNGSWLCYRPRFKSSREGMFEDYFSLPENWPESGRVLQNARLVAERAYEDRLRAIVASTDIGELEPSYRLISVISHLGLESTSGHYICDIWNQREHRWLHCNDSSVWPISEDDVLHSRTTTAYLLFYMTA